jgi:hypothetical protein
MLSRRQREGVGLAVALAVHATALLLMGRRAEGPVDGLDHAPPLEVEVEAPPVEPPAPQPPEAPSKEPETAPAPAAARVAAIAPGPHEHGEEAPPPELAPPAPSASSFTFNPASPNAAPGLSDEALGLAGRNRFLGVAQLAVPGGPEAHGEAPAAEGPRNVAPGVDQSIRDALDAHDHELGFDVGGPIIAVAEELTRPSDTPMNGRAVFEVTIDADGNVGDVRLVDAHDARGAWESLGAQIGATLRARRIAWRLSKGHGVAVRFEINSRYVLPSGSTPGKVVSDPFARASGNPEELVQAGGHFDLSDIGARASRNVHARILNEKRF